jgi:hypothetical protein
MINHYFKKLEALKDDSLFFKFFCHSNQNNISFPGHRRMGPGPDQDVGW